MGIHRRRAALTALVWLGAVLSVGGSACSRSPRAARAARPAQPATIVFTNQSLYEAAVFVLPRGGSQVRIGTVQPGRTETLTVRGAALPAGGSLTVVARLLAISRTPSTGNVTLLPGERLSVTLPSDARILNVLPGSP